MENITDAELVTMSDDEFEEAQELHTDAQENPSPVEEEISESDEGSDQEEEAPAEESVEASEEIEESEEEEEVTETESEETADTEPEPEDSETKSHEEPKETEVDKDFNYQESFKHVMEPLKVSGKEVQVKSIDDMRNLAMMGIDYSRKMRDIKPLRSVGETLTKAGIIVDGVVDADALTRLIDINGGNKDAIAQLLSEHNIDPLDMDTEDVNYTPEAEVVSDEAIAIQDVEKELVSRGTVQTVIAEVEKLDEKSKAFLTAAPQNLLNLEEDIRSGAYEEIMGAVMYEKSLGRLTDMSDMDAYIQLATAQTPEPQAQPAPKTEKPSVAKRKAAGITKRAPANKQKKVYDYVGMSDEEFEDLMPETSLY